MIDRLLLGAVMSVTGYTGLYPEPPVPPTLPTLHARAVTKSMSAMCGKKKHGKQAAELCKKWKEQQRG
jgi:hypothetical protein